MRTIKGDAYRNLHFPGRVYSFKSNGVVILHSPQLLIENARFFVSEAGRQRVIREKKKNVHAGVRGDLVVNPCTVIDLLQKVQAEGVKAYYNPYEVDSFVGLDGKKLHGATAVWLSDSNDGPVLAYRPVYD